MNPYYGEEMLEVILSGLISLVPSVLFSIVSYVLTSLALYTVAKRRGIGRAWLAWIPVVNAWLIGSISDQYQYVVRGRNCAKRKYMLVLNLITMVLCGVLLIQVFNLVMGLIAAAGSGSQDSMMVTLMGHMLGIEGGLLLMAGVAIAYAVIYYIALYDIYKSMDPGNCVLFLVLSILFGVTQPFFLFFNRNKELGMPPRKRPVLDAQQEPPRQTWEPDNRDYL